MNPFGMKGAQAYAFWTVFATLAMVTCYNFVDLPLANAVHPYHGTVLYVVARQLTKLGEAYWYILPALLIALAALPLGRRHLTNRAVYVIANIAAGGLAVTLLKMLFGRARPARYFESDVYGFFFLQGDNPYFSFPSGHATVFFCAWMSFAVLWPRWRYAFFTIAALLAFTRVLVEAHYLSDVIGGALLGTCCSYYIASIWRRPLHLPEAVPVQELELEPQSETA